MARASLVWTTPALEDLDDIASFIARDNAKAASALVQRLLSTVERLQDHPASGRLMPEVPGKIYREVIVSPCRIIYRRDGKQVLIVHVLRSERLLRADRLF